MKKRIIIIGDSFSLGVGADFPDVFDNVNKLAPKIDSNWYDNWKMISSDHIKDEQLQKRTGNKENLSIIEHLSSLTNQFNEWTTSVYRTDFFRIFKEQNPGCDPAKEDLLPGLKTQGYELRHYPKTWSNQLNDLLPDIDIINLSKGGSSMASVVSSLSTFINMDTKSNEYETLVFFQAPEPCRKQIIKTTHERDCPVYDSEIENKLAYYRDYNINHSTNICIDDNEYNFSKHSTAYAVHDLYIGEWFQNIFNAQQICKANNFHMAWCTSQEHVDHLLTNKNNLFPNVLDLDVRFDRMPHVVDKEFVSLVGLHRIIGVQNLDLGEIYSGCMHFTGKTQKLVAKYLAKSLISNEEFWWQK